MAAPTLPTPPFRLRPPTVDPLGQPVTDDGMGDAPGPDVFFDVWGESFNMGRLAYDVRPLGEGFVIEAGNSETGYRLRTILGAAHSGVLSDTATWAYADRVGARWAKNVLYGFAYGHGNPLAHEILSLYLHPNPFIGIARETARAALRNLLTESDDDGLH